MDTEVLIRKVQRAFGDDASIFLEEEDIIDWINDAETQISRETPTLVAEASVAANAFPWSLPSTFLRIMRVQYDTKPIVFITAEDLDSKYVDLTDTTGEPLAYYFVTSGSAKVLKIYPAAEASDTTTVTIQYSKLPTPLSNSGDPLNVPSEFHEDIVLFCKARAHDRNENYRASELAMGEFNSRISRRIDSNDSPEDTYHVIRDDPWEFFS